MATLPDDSECDAIVAAALALIDEAYSPNHQRCTATRRRDEVDQLREQIAELERVLSDIRGSHECGPLDGSSLAALWAQIAENQRRERREAIGENAVLRDYVTSQKALALHLQRALTRVLAQLRPIERHAQSIQPPRTQDLLLMCGSLTRGLDTIAAVASGPWIGLFPPIGTEFRDHHATCSREGLQLQNRYASYVPFKLSLVVSELWNMLRQQSLGARAPLSMSAQSSDEATGQYFLQWHGSSTPLQVQGSSGVRRVMTADGSVVFVAVSMAKGSSEVLRTNLMDGLEMHEASWIRVGRVPTAPSLVYMESVCFIKIQPVTDFRSEVSTLEQVRDTMLEATERIGASNIQKLENRLLDATMC